MDQELPDFLAVLPGLGHWLRNLKVGDVITEAVAAEFGKQVLQALTPQISTSLTEGDCIAKSRRIMALVENYADNPSTDTRGDLRRQLLTEFMLLGARVDADSTLDEDIDRIRVLVSREKPSDQQAFERVINALRCNQLQKGATT